MTVEPRYLLKCKDGFKEIPTIRDAISDALLPMLDAGDGIECAILAHAVMKVLVLDTTVQDIADAWDGYLVTVDGRGEDEAMAWYEVAVLLEALTEEATE